MAKEITIPKATLTKFNRSVQRDAANVLRVMSKKRYEDIEDQKMIEMPVGDFERIMYSAQNIVSESETFSSRL